MALKSLEPAAAALLAPSLVPAPAWTPFAPGTRITTPHSQFRQLILGWPVPRSLTKRPLLAFGLLSVLKMHQKSRRRDARASHHALSDRLALPTYTQPGDNCPASASASASAAPTSKSAASAPVRELRLFVPLVLLRTNIILLCINNPSRVLTQSRINSVGKLGARHHFACTQMVPAAYVAFALASVHPPVCKFGVLRLSVSRSLSLSRRPVIVTHPSPSPTLGNRLFCRKIDGELVLERVRRRRRSLRFGLCRTAQPRVVFCHAIITCNSVRPLARSLGKSRSSITIRWGSP